MTVDSQSSPHQARLLAIALILVAGVLTGAQLGKIAPLIPWYGTEVGLSLVGAGWLAALLGIFIAVFALPAGWAIDRIGVVTSIGLGVVALTLGGLWLAVSTHPVQIFTARLVEAAGYLALCVALPAALNAISPVSWKGPVLAIWSGFVPLGFALSDFLAGALLPRVEPSMFLLMMTALFGTISCIALLVMRTIPVPMTAPDESSIVATLSPDVILLSCGFGAFVVVSVSMFTFMPVFVATQGAHYLLGAGSIALCVPLGNLLASLLVGGRGADGMARLGVAGFAVSMATAIPAFTMQDPYIATIAALGLAISGALVASVQFAAIPFSTPRSGSVAVALGVVCQAGGIATLFGPPVAAWIVETYDWSGFGYFLAFISALGLLSMLPLTRKAVR